MVVVVACHAGDPRCCTVRAGPPPVDEQHHGGRAQALLVAQADIATNASSPAPLDRFISLRACSE